MERAPTTTQPADGAPLDVLYIHPHNHLVDDRYVPVGAITSMNAAGGSKLGLYAAECGDAPIRRARVVALDWHWHFSLPAVRKVVERVRRLNPSALLVLGGLTAAWFGRRVFRILPVDFVAVGEAEPGFAILARDARTVDPSRLPNFVAADGTAGPRRPLTPTEFDALDPITVDWFPSLAGPRFEADLFLGRGCTRDCPGRCLSRLTLGGPSRLHSPEWLAGTIDRIRTTLGPGATVRLQNFGCRDPGRAAGIFAALPKPDPDLNVTLFSCGLDAAFIEEALARFPRATVSVLAPWESLNPGEPPAVGEALEERLLELARIVARVRQAPRARLVCHVLSRDPSPTAALARRVGLEPSSLMASDNFLLWTPEGTTSRRTTVADLGARIERMARCSAQAAFLEVLTPDVHAIYPVREEPHGTPPPDAPVPSLATFHRAVLRGWRAWGTILPDPFRLRAWVIRWPEPDGPPADYTRLLADHLGEDCLAVVDLPPADIVEDGIEARWPLPDLPEGPDRPGTRLAVAIAGLDLEPYLREVPTRVARFLLPPRFAAPGARMVLRLETSDLVVSMTDTVGTVEIGRLRRRPPTHRLVGPGGPERGVSP
jgi:hypothetical protein